MEKANIPLFKVFMPKTVMPALERVLYSGFVAEGEQVGQFESVVSDYIGNPHCVAVNSCTMALTIAFKVCGVGPDSEVITSPLTCIASNMPILLLGGKTVWADVDPQTGMMDPAGIEGLMTESTKAILVLHKEGDPANLDEILAIAKRHDLKVIEDAAHAFGARYHDKRIGNHGDFICFSFQAIKHITTGDGGVLICKDKEDCLRARKLKWFGIDRDNRQSENSWDVDIDEWGFKGNMNNISAAIGIEQMKFLDEILAKHYRNGTLYTENLKNCPGVSMIRRRSSDFSTYWVYCLLAEDRQGLIEKLNEYGISSGPIHQRNDRYRVFQESKTELPNLDAFAQRELCLPCGWWVEEEDVSMICDIIKEGW